ncbi:hypothetical protein VNO80_24559 [Phaseolus coccineus]|uniref:Uncharacterized protein n=1 Tax=Phaseolus coccineus TaxID=3886 RepID=A0AAN9LT15_PHACN
MSGAVFLFSPSSANKKSDGGKTLEQKMKMDPLDGNLHFFEFDFNSFIYILGIADQLRRPSLYHMQLATLQACITFLACF